MPTQVVNAPPTTTKAYAYDTRKNVADNGRGSFLYDLRGNLSQATVRSLVSTYAYDAFNHRVRKTVGSTTTLFLYDEAGNLAGEYSSVGAAQMEHIYLGDLPIGAMAGSTLYAVHSDYLGTPRVVSNGSTIVWKWDSSDPFGVNTPSVSTLVYNKRFPGQYYDSETGLHDNHFRVYDPQLGRYMQPDPMGLMAGKNPFNYANQNPLNGSDMDGLLGVPVDTGQIFNKSHGGAPFSKAKWQLFQALTDDGKYRVNMYKFMGMVNFIGGVAPLDINFDYTANCHGTTFEQGRYWIENEEVEKILKGDGYSEVKDMALVRKGDVVVYTDQTGVVHSVQVSSTANGKIMGYGKGGIEFAPHVDLVGSPGSWSGAAKYTFYSKGR